LNPVRAKIVEDPKDYKWSSYRAYAYGKADPLVDSHPIYAELSKDETDRRKKYRDFVRGMIRERSAMKGEMDRRLIYGSEEFVDVVRREHKVDAVIRHRGRPGKDHKDSN